jgi:hypothetical protein
MTYNWHYNRRITKKKKKNIRKYNKHIIIIKLREKKWLNSIKQYIKNMISKMMTIREKDI